jgi:hypothetical protein
MPDGPTVGDDGDDFQGYGGGFGSVESPDGDDHRDLLNDLPEDDGTSDGPGRSPHVGEGLTDLERDQLDELERIRAAEGARDRFERSTGLSELGSGGRGETAIDRDALAVIDAAERFGVDPDTSEQAEAERGAIAEALAITAKKRNAKRAEHTFYATIARTTTQGNSLMVTMKVPWEFKDQVNKALDTLPWNCLVTMKEVDPGG